MSRRPRAVPQPEKLLGCDPMLVLDAERDHREPAKVARPALPATPEWMCGSIRVHETSIKIRGQWRSLDWAIDKHGIPVDFLLTVKRDLKATKRLSRATRWDCRTFLGQHSL